MGTRMKPQQTIMMKLPIKIFADFNNADGEGRVRLNTSGTLNDLENNNVKLETGLEILLDDNDGLTAIGIVQFSETESIWIAIVDWNKLK